MTTPPQNDTQITSALQTQPYRFVHVTKQQKIRPNKYRPTRNTTWNYQSIDNVTHPLTTTSVQLPCYYPIHRFKCHKDISTDRRSTVNQASQE